MTLTTLKRNLTSVVVQFFSDYEERTSEYGTVLVRQPAQNEMFILTQEALWYCKN